MARKKFACDFETTTKLDDCRVWGFGYREIGNPQNIHIGQDIDEFMQWTVKTKADLYFHNLKFDGAFIVNWLMKNGYTFSKDPMPNTFNVLISNMNAWYMIDICYGYKGKRKLHTVIYDSLKKLPFPIKTIAHAFELPVKKGDIDYKKDRPVGYEITEEEKEYIINDVEILAQALEIQFKQGLTRMTTGSDAMGDFKDMMNKNDFKKLFPVLPMIIDTDIRKAYRGGYTYLNDRYAEQVIDGGIVFDINGMYSATMINESLPVGAPRTFNGEYVHDPEYPLFIQRVSCEFELKEGHIPTIQIKTNPLFKKTEYLKSSEGERVDLYVTNVDLELMKKHYHLYELEYHNGYKFRQATGLFKEYIEKWSKVKEENTGAIRLLAKLMLNSLYGKFASNPDVTGKVPYLKEDGSNGFKVGEEEIKDPVYTPMGVFITSYSRKQIIDMAQANYDRFIYCDTDSVHLEGTDIPDAFDGYIHPTELGKWDHERTYVRGKYLRQKTYIHEYEDDGEIKTSVTCAGMPDETKKLATIENFKRGFSGYGRLNPVQVSGGIVLVDTMYTLK